ncbi:MAG: POT family MFS transporter [Deltaproteobacteria bacterium]|jgi:proton-dependent oligopeptide transporter, POT family|nr:POT family MFS transporter [Deltaproteobacteria bacterium]MBT6488644.1 POT family MFS transporter [Deltaproteobacteria bacterium]
MSEHQYLTAPVASKDMPKGIPYIIGNEAAERFSFYGMKGILTIFMTKYLFLLSDAAGTPMERTEAIARYHEFTSLVYLTPVMGAFLADTILGKYRTILSLSIVYCLGHFALAFMGSPGMSAENWMLTGLYLIALGSGGIKPCVSAHVGDQFGKTNGHLLSKVFGWFYISINVGAAASTLATPLLLEWYGPHWAFGVPGVLMAIATVLFWMGRHEFVHIPPRGKEFLKETFSVEGLLTIGKLFIIFAFVAVFWALFDQTGSSWVLQAEDLNRNWMGVEWLSSQIQAVNPVMIVTLVPLFTYVIYPAIDKIFPLTPLRKIAIGLFIMVPGFAIVAILQTWIDSGETPSIAWQLFAYAVLTASEVMVSITCLEFAYTQSPVSMKSVVMAVFLFSVSLGNYFTAGVNKFILVESGEVSSVSDTTKSIMGESDKRIRFHFDSNDTALPRTEIGTELVKADLDEWGTPLEYRMINRNTYKLVSLGADKEAMTPDDIVHLVSVTRPAVNQDNADKPLTWREKRMIELMGAEGQKQVDRERGGVPTIEFSENLSVGGQNKLEGAAYFWFWTWTMLGTAMLFVLVALWYKPKTYLQEEAA